MKVLPAIDLKQGKCVRLYQGEFDRVTEYAGDPAAIARDYWAMGFDCLHVVDLDGARFGQQRHGSVISGILSDSNWVLQLGGGIRNRDTVARWLTAGVARCVVGSVAITQPETVGNWLEEFGADRIVVALDVRVEAGGMPTLTTHGWTRSAGKDLWDCIDRYLSAGLKHVLCTDVSRDGAMTGPNLELYREFLSRYPEIQLQASGGVRDALDLRMLSELGAAAAITGRALLDGKIDTEELRPFLRVA